MPAGHPPIRAHPAKPFRTLRDAAASGEVVLMRCGLCRRGATFLASHLIQVVDPMHPVHLPPFGCSKCGTTEYTDIRMATPQSKDVGLAAEQTGSHSIERRFAILLAVMLRDRRQHILDQLGVKAFAKLDVRAFECCSDCGNFVSNFPVSANVARQT